MLFRSFQLKLGGAIPGDYLNLDGTLDVSGTLLPLLTGRNPPVPGGSAVPPGTAADLLTGGTR